MPGKPGDVLLRGFTAVFLLHQLSLGSGSRCTLSAVIGTAQDYLSICAMCSDTDAAVRWAVREGAVFDIVLLWYNCSHHNGTEMSDFVGDICFEEYPNWIESHTGTTGVGHQLWTGVQCVFSVGYRHDGQTITESSSCYIKSPEECAENPDECNIDRVSRLNEEGECEVQCAAGYGGQLCNNIDECTAGSNTCDDNADCHDTDGSYWCQCLPGFQGDGYNCTNTNECTAGSSTCDDNAECHDIDGSYWCVCLPGFQGDGYNCTNVDECTAGSNTCDDNAECHDTDGSYWCQCLPGFQGDGYDCTDINECQVLMEKCVKNAECLNSEGSYSCQCKLGFIGDGYSYCADSNNKCLNVTCGENAECLNTEGAYSCQCKSGFAGDGYNCADQSYLPFSRKLVIMLFVILLYATTLLLMLILFLILPCRYKLTILSNRATSSSESENSSGCDRLYCENSISSNSTKKTAGGRHFGSGECKIELITGKQAVSTFY